VGGSVHRNSNMLSKVDKNIIERLLCNVYAASVVLHDKIPVLRGPWPRAGSAQESAKIHACSPTFQKLKLEAPNSADRDVESVDSTSTAWAV
jgi:hypothetical protein